MAVNKKRHNDFIQERGNYSTPANELWTWQGLDSISIHIYGYILSQPATWSAGRNNISKNLNLDPTTVTRRLMQLEGRNMLKIDKSGQRWSFEVIPANEWLTERSDHPVDEIDQSMPSTSTERSDRPVLSGPIAHIQEDNKNNKYIPPVSIVGAKDHTSNKQAFDLEALYKLYPRKRGKDAGMKKLAKIIKSQADYDQFKACIEKYVEEIKQRPVDKQQFVLNWSTFVNGRYKDYLEENMPTKPKLGLVKF